MLIFVLNETEHNIEYLYEFAILVVLSCFLRKSVHINFIAKSRKINSKEIEHMFADRCWTNGFYSWEI